MNVAKFTVEGMIGTPDPALKKQLEGMGVYNYTQPSDLRSFIEDNADADEFEVTFDSVGGDVVKGFEIYDLLKQIGKTKQVTTIAKRADSIASVGFLAGTIRKAVKGGSFLIHSAWLSPSDLDPEVRLNESTLEEIQRSNRNADSQILSVYAEIAGRDLVGQLSDLMKKETNLNSEELYKLNFATEVIEGEEQQARKAIAYNSMALDVILNQSTMADNAILDKLAKGMESLTARLRAMGGAKSMTISLADGAKLFIYSEDGEIEGKKAVLATAEGEPTEELAPAGDHALVDGRAITVNEEGIITAVSEAAPTDMEVMTKERDELAVKVAAMEADKEEGDKEIVALKAANVDLNTKVGAFATELEGIQAMVNEVAGDGKTRTHKNISTKPDAKAWGEMKPSERAYYNLTNQK